MSKHNTTISRQLGSEQRRFLETLVEHGYWYGGAHGCGWQWGSKSETLRLLESLLRRALVTSETRESGMRKGSSVIYWIPSAAGAGLAAEWKLERAERKAAAAATAAAGSDDPPDDGPLGVQGGTDYDGRDGSIEEEEEEP
jgi:hypothetical protein